MSYLIRALKHTLVRCIVLHIMSASIPVIDLQLPDADVIDAIIDAYSHIG